MGALPETPHGPVIVPHGHLLVKSPLLLKNWVRGSTRRFGSCLLAELEWKLGLFAEVIDNLWRILKLDREDFSTAV